MEGDCAFALGEENPIELETLPFRVSSVGVVNGEVLWLTIGEGTWVCRGPPYVCERISHLGGTQAVSRPGEMLVSFGASGLIQVRPLDGTLRLTASTDDSVLSELWPNGSPYGACGSRYVFLTHDGQVRDVLSPEVTYRSVPPERLVLEARGLRTYARRLDGTAVDDLCSGEHVEGDWIPTPDWISHGHYQWVHLPGHNGNASLRREGLSCVYQFGGRSHCLPAAVENDPCSYRAHVDAQGVLWLWTLSDDTISVQRWVGQDQASGSR